ncbi:sugar kinase [Holotrichia oblita]|uniref:Sugar kinase n=1 Tax=Holotrichia oblita TaxID=644536 RepID=A0ACB9STA6_HOLOL|nr:sugar kinase [Holotrichia oblita]
MASSIVIVGSCMMDFVCYSPRLPHEGETLHGYKFVTNFGGKGANQCVAAHKLGGSTTMIARVGDDLWGDKYISNFKDLGINHVYVRKTPGISSGIAQISVADSGANQIIIVAGANSQLSVNDIQDAKSAIQNANVLVCQLETSADVAIEAMKLCKGQIILNGAPALATYSPELLTLPSIFCVNESEASVFSGVSVHTPQDAEIALKSFMKKGCQCVIITMGSEGAVFASKDDPTPIHVRAPKKQCVDSTGAGDSFIGCLAYLLAEYKQLPMNSCVSISCSMATDSCTKPGTQISFPDADILKNCMQQYLNF